MNIPLSDRSHLNNWFYTFQVSALSVSCGEQRSLSGGAHPMSAWATTERGDIFVHEPESNQTPGINKAASM